LICKKTFEVFNGCASTNDLTAIGQAKSLRKAIEIAEKFEEGLWEDGTYLEYGIHFSNNTKGYRVVRTKNE
jgi:hypothetical protein